VGAQHEWHTGESAAGVSSARNGGSGQTNRDRWELRLISGLCWGHDGTRIV
jgi:hypothetical protein